MHAVKWRLISDGYGFYTYKAEEEYSAAMLVEDLMEAGISISQVAYEEDADVGMKYYGGELSPKAFLESYDHLKRVGMGGMDYRVYCTWRDLTFEVGMADNEYGKSHNRIVFSKIPSKDSMRDVLKAVGKTC